MALQRSVKTQKKYLKEYIKPELDAFLKNHNIDQIKIEKIYNYYGMGVPALLGMLYAMPRGYPINNTERAALTYLGALTGIIDDAFDENYIAVDRVYTYIQNQSSFTPQSPSESLMVFLGNKVLEYLPPIHQNDFWKVANQIFALQQQSLMQQHNLVNTNQLLSITRDKGGWPFVLYRYCLENPLPKEEQDLVFELGASMQLGNDIFDVHKDLQQEIRTVPNTILQIKNLKPIFYKWMRLSVDQYAKVFFDNESSKKAFLVYYLLGMSRCVVCMEQYEKLEVLTQGRFKPQEYSRKQLICDMEKWSNIWRSIRVFQKMRKEFRYFDTEVKTQESR